jgi:hypothetical protein
LANAESVAFLLVRLLLECKRIADETPSVSLKKNKDLAERNNQVATIIDYIPMHSDHH